MRRSFLSSFSLGICALLTAAECLAAEPPAPPMAEPPAANIGHLTCSFGEEVKTETSAGSARSIMCVFRSLTNNVEELYVGTAYLTAALAGSGDVSISWIVKAPEGSTPPSLEQTYTAQSNADTGGDGAATLVAPKAGNAPSGVELHALPELSGADRKPTDSDKIAVIELKLKTTTT